MAGSYAVRLRSFYNYCCRKDLCAKNIASLLEPVKIKQKEREFITEDELGELVAAIEQPVIRTVVQAMFYTGTRDDEIIPRYAIPGQVKTKAIYMSDMVARLAVEFCKGRNLSQREVMEGALLEYLMKYGSKREVDGLLNNL